MCVCVCVGVWVGVWVCVGGWVGGCFKESEGVFGFNACSFPHSVCLGLCMPCVPNWVCGRLWPFDLV